MPPQALLWLLGAAALLAGCGGPAAPSAAPTPVLPEAVLTPFPPAGLANPASVFCEQVGGRLALRTDAAGNVSGNCGFSDGSSCEEWALFRGECVPPSTLPAPPSARPAATAAGQARWATVEVSRFGYAFEAPADAEIELRADWPGVAITGPLTNNERWPQIIISHPADREDYRPPPGVDLAAWMTERELVVGRRLADATIGGERAIHTRFDRSPQSFAVDRYFFARGGRLYTIVIGHAGDREDWALYQHFLDSFHFLQ